MKVRIHLISVCLIAISFSSVVAQSIESLGGLKFRQVAIEDGLPSNRVYEVAEDQLGFTWFATTNGLCRFDGQNFMVFKNEPDDNFSISQDHVRTVYADSKGNIWVGTLSGGLCKFSYESGKFTRFNNDENDSASLLSDEILTVFEDSNEKIWIGTEGGISIFDPTSETFQSFTRNINDSSSIGEGGVIGIVEDAHHRIWATTWDGGLNLACPRNDGTFSFRNFYPFGIKHYWSLYLDSKKRLWVGTFDGGLLLMKTDNGNDCTLLEPEFINFPYDPSASNGISKEVIFDIEEDLEGRIWLATTFGLNVFDPSSLQPDSMTIEELEAQKSKITFKAYNYEYERANGMPSQEILGLGKCKNGTMWACTAGGIAIFNHKKRSFRAWYISENDLSNFTVVSAIAKQSNGRVWVGTEEDGMFVYFPETNKFRSISSVVPSRSAERIGNFISQFYLQHDSILWVGCQNGLGRLNLSDYSLEWIMGANDYALSKGNEAWEFRQIYEDSKGKIWVATNTNLFRYDPKSEKVDEWKHDEGKVNSLSHTVVSGIVEGDDGCMWVATHRGVDKLCFDHSEDGYTLTNFHHDFTDKFSIGGNRPSSICKKNGHLYIGTEAGLSKMIGEGKFITYGNNDSSGDVYIRSLAVGEGNDIWGTSTNSIFRFNTIEGTFQFFDKTDGLHDTYFMLGSAHKSADNEVFFGGRMGVTSFFEKDIKKDSLTSKIYLTDFLVDNKSKEFNKNAVVVNDITLSHKESNITFVFASVNYTKPKLTRYTYLLEGVDKDWVAVGKQNNASYTNLSGGDYIFKVKGTNENGVWDDIPSLVVPVHIALPFWKTNWFITLCLLFLVTGIYIIIYFQTKSIHQQNQFLEKYNDMLNKEVEERKKVEESLLKSNEDLTRSNYDLEQFAYIASHDLQEPLRMVGNFVQLLNRRYANIIDENGREYINYSIEGVTRMSELIQNILKFSRVGRSDIELSKVSLKAVINKIITELADRIKEKNAEIVVFEIPAETLCEPNQIGIVFSNLITNAIKFNKSTSPKIKVDCKEKEDEWLYSVYDNGIGISTVFKDKIFEIFKRLHSRSEFEGHGIGLSLCKRIITRHGGKIWFDSEEGQGATFFFTIKKNIESQKNGNATEPEKDMLMEELQVT